MNRVNRKKSKISYATLRPGLASVGLNSHVMKSIYTLLLAAGLLLQFPAYAQKKETRTHRDFNSVSFGVSGTCYIVPGAAYSVTLEGNADVLKEVETSVEGDRLTIRYAERWNYRNRSEGITVRIQLPSLAEVRVAGSGDVVVEGTATGQALDLRVSGSGSITTAATLTGPLSARVSGSGSVHVKGSCSKLNADVSGSGRVEVEVQAREEAEFSISGSGKITAQGSSPRLSASNSGSGRVTALDFVTQWCEIRISGSGHMSVNVTEELDVRISGSGSVDYKGDPKHVNSNASGSGRVRKV